MYIQFSLLIILCSDNWVQSWQVKWVSAIWWLKSLQLCWASTAAFSCHSRNTI